MTTNVFSYTSKSEQDTVGLGEEISKIAKKGDCFALYGTLGMGKSVFCRAFVQSLTDAEEVPSPTFTLLQTYGAKDFEIYHFDLYRIKKSDEIFEMGMEEALHQGVTLIEWPEPMAAYLPRNVFKVEITPAGQVRKITISTTDEDKAKRLSAIPMLSKDA